MPPKRNVFGRCNLIRVSAESGAGALEEKRCAKSELCSRGTLVEVFRDMSRWLHIAAVVVPIGVLTATLGARANSNVVERASVQAGVELPEQAQLFAVGGMLVGLASWAERAARR
jgi:hypothetical protein